MTPYPGRDPRPLVSVAIPAFRATQTLHRAVTSVFGCGLSRDAVEIIVASDDGADYSHHLPTLPNLRFCPVGPVRSGVGAARNRAIAAARGRFVTYLDADDSWAPGFLSNLLPRAQANGAAFAPTQVLENDLEIVRSPPKGAALDFATLGKSGASFRPLVAAGTCGRFRNSVAQDIFHAVEIIALHGGSCPVSDVPYQLHLGSESVSAGQDYATRIAKTYTTYRRDIEQGLSRVPEHHVPAASAVFETRLALNAAYQHNGQGERFYHYLRHQQHG